MAKSINEQKFDSVLATLRDTFKERGWRKNRFRFNRRTDQDVMQVVHFHLGHSEPPGTVYVPPIRSDVSGLFTIEVGVYLEAVNRPIAKGQFLSAWDCSIRIDPSELSNAYPDHWWKNEDSAAPALANFIQGTVFPLLEDLETTDLVLQNLPMIAPNLSTSVVGPWRFLLSRIYVARGEVDAAQARFNEHWDYMKKRWPESRQFDSLARWAEQHKILTPN